MAANNYHVLPTKHTLALSCNYHCVRVEVDSGVPGPTDEACLAVTQQFAHLFWVV